MYVIRSKIFVRVGCKSALYIRLTHYEHPLTVPSITFNLCPTIRLLNYNPGQKEKFGGHLLFVPNLKHKNFKLLFINTKIEFKTEINYHTNYSHKVRIVQLQSLFYYNTTLILLLYHVVQRYFKLVD